MMGGSLDVARKRCRYSFNMAQYGIKTVSQWYHNGIKMVPSCLPFPWWSCSMFRDVSCNGSFHHSGIAPRMPEHVSAAERHLNPRQKTGATNPFARIISSPSACLLDVFKVRKKKVVRRCIQTRSACFNEDTMTHMGREEKHQGKSSTYTINSISVTGWHHMWRITRFIRSAAEWF